MEMMRGIKDINTACFLRGVHFRVVEPGWTFEPEYHHMFELASCRSGQFQVEVGSRLVILNPGDWCLIKSGKRHTTVNSSTAHSSLLVIHFDIDSPKLRQLLQNEAIDYLPYSKVNQTRISEFVTIFDHVLLKGISCDRKNEIFISISPGESLLVQAHFMLLLNQWVMWVQSGERHGDKFIISSTYHLDLAHKAAEMMTEREQPGTIGEAAKELGVSRTHLSRIFTRVFGMPPQQYVAKHRMKRAREMLATTHLSIKEISDSLGYVSPSHFNTQYYRWFGISPGKARPMLQQNEITVVDE